VSLTEICYNKTFCISAQCKWCNANYPHPNPDPNPNPNPKSYPNLKLFNE